MNMSASSQTAMLTAAEWLYNRFPCIYKLHEQQQPGINSLANSRNSGSCRIEAQKLATPAIVGQARQKLARHFSIHGQRPGETRLHGQLLVRHSYTSRLYIVMLAVATQLLLQKLHACSQGQQLQACFASGRWSSMAISVERHCLSLAAAMLVAAGWSAPMLAIVGRTHNMLAAARCSLARTATVLADVALAATLQASAGHTATG